MLPMAAAAFANVFRILPPGDLLATCPPTHPYPSVRRPIPHSTRVSSSKRGGRGEEWHCAGKVAKGRRGQAI